MGDRIQAAAARDVPRSIHITVITERIRSTTPHCFTSAALECCTALQALQQNKGENDEKDTDDGVRGVRSGWLQSGRHQRPVWHWNRNGHEPHQRPYEHKFTTAYSGSELEFIFE